MANFRRLVSTPVEYVGRLGSSVMDYVFGHDVFISYTHRDAKPYAGKLRDELQKRNYSCFLDADDLPVGEELSSCVLDANGSPVSEKLSGELVRALRRSQTLVLVASPCAFVAKYVWQELDQFRRDRPHRSIVPIVFGQETQDALEGKTTTLKPSPVDSKLGERLRTKNLVRIVEPVEVKEATPTGPSERTVGQLLHRFTFTRRNTRRQRIVEGVLVSMTALFVVAMVFWRSAAREGRVIQVRRLAAEAGALRERFPQRSLLLAVEATQKAKVRDLREEALAPAEQGLRDVVAYAGGRPLGSADKPITAMGLTGADLYGRRWLVAASKDDGSVRAWAVGSGKPSQAVVLRPRGAPILALAASSQSTWLVTGSEDGAVTSWDLTADHPRAQPVNTAICPGIVTAVAVLADRTVSATVDAGHDGFKTCLWHLGPGEGSTSPHRMITHTGPVHTIVVSPSQHWLIVGTDTNPGRVELWNLVDANAGPRILDGHRGAVISVAMDPKERWLISGSADKTVQLWSLLPGDSTHHTLVSHAEWVSAVAISPDGRWAASGGGDGRVFRWDLCAQDPAGTPNPSRVDEHECAGIRREKSSIADSRRLASGHRGAIVSLGFTSDSALLVTGGDDQTVRVWNLADPDLASPEVLRGHDGPITAVAISPDHRWIFSGSEDHSVRQWNLGASESSGLQRAAASTPELLGIHEGGEVYAVAISFDGRFIATGAEGGGTCLWQRSQDGPSERVVLQDCSVGGKPGSRTDNPPPPPAPATRSIAISPDSRWLVSGGEGVNARIWDLTAQPFRPREIGGPIGALAISRNSHWLAMGGDGVVVHLLDLTKPPQAGQTLLRPAPAGGEAEAREPELDRAGARPAITAIAISADNHWLAAGDYFGRVYLWDLNTPGEGARQPVLYRHQGPITAMAISPDGRWLVTASKDHPMVVRWDLARVDAGGAPQDLSGHTKGGVRSMAFSSDGRWLVTGGEDKTARLWDLGSLLGNPHSVALRHGETVSVVAISSQEPRVITGSYDKTVRLWDLTAADPSANPVVLNHNEGINAIAASADGRFLVTGTSYDFKATLFMLRTEDLVQLARDIAGRDLTGSERQASSLE